MATQIYQQTSEFQIATETIGIDKLGLLPAELQQTLKLAGILQTSLEVKNVLNYFLDSVKQVVKFSGAFFQYDPLELKLEFGKNTRHTCAYRLSLAGESLGELIFYRSHRFGQTELEQLESLFCQLIYPIRNAIWYQQALKAAKVDPLTGVNNRASMDTSLSREVELAHRNNSALSLIVLDIDHFKAINDTFGHTGGDCVLKDLVNCIKETMRSSDILFRYGGEEFTLLLTGIGKEGARYMAERIRQAIENYNFIFDNTRIAVTASLGIATLTTPDDAKRLFNKADAALYQAKEAGRNRVRFYAEPRK